MPREIPGLIGLSSPPWLFLPARLIPKLTRFLSWKRGISQSLEPDAPLFVSAQGRRLSPRAAHWRFAWWQRRAGFDRHYKFHALRHSAVTNVYRASKDLFLAQRLRGVGRVRDFPC